MATPAQSSTRQAFARPAARTVNDGLTKAATAGHREQRVRRVRPARSGAYSRRVAVGDVEALTGLISLADDINEAIDHAVHGLREAGYSWADIGSWLGISRQAAQQRWGRPGNTSQQ